MKLSLKLLVVILGSVTVAVGMISIVAYHFTKSSLGNAIKQNQLGVARQTMEQIDNLLYERYLDIQAMAGESFIVDGLMQKKGKIQKNEAFRLKELTMVTGPWYTLFVVDLQGRVVLSTNNAFIGKSIFTEPNRTKAFHEAVKGEVYHSDLVQLADIQKYAVMFSAPVRNKADPKQPVIGVVLGGFAWPAVTEFLQDIPLLASAHAVIVNREGAIIACSMDGSDMIGVRLGDRPFVRDVLSGQAKSIHLSQTASPMGEESLTSYVPEKGFLSYRSSGWGLILEVPYQQALLPASRAAWFLVLLLLPVFIITTGLILFSISRLVIRPIALLRGTTQAIGDGDFSQKAVVLSPDEIGGLANAFNRMIDHLKQTTVSKDWLEIMVGSISDAIIATDERMMVAFMNREAESLTGWTSSEAIGKKNISQIFNIIHAVTRQKMANPVQEVMKEEKIFYFTRPTLLVGREGMEIPIDEKSSPIRNSHGKTIGAVLVFRNIAEKYKRDQELIDSEKKFRAVTDSIADAIVSIDSLSYIVFWNASAAKIFGYERDEILGRSLTALMPERFRDLHLNGMRRLITTGEKKVVGKTVELVGLKKSGEEFPLELTLSMWVSEKEKEKELFFTGILRDVSQRKTIEKERAQLEVQLRAAQKLESIGQLAAGIAHEINTPTQYIGDNTRFLQTSFKVFLDLLELTKKLSGKSGAEPEFVRELEQFYRDADMTYLAAEIPTAIDQSLEGIDRVSQIVKAMKEFSHPGGQEKTPFDINHAIETTVLIARNEWKYVCEVKTDFDKSLPLVPCMPGEMNQVFLNLIVNAAHSIAEKKGSGDQQKGVITIQTSTEGPWVIIKVSDTGNGIPENIRDRVFDPFFTTKEVGKGSGQGLAIARSVIVDKHRGTIDFESTIGTGTTFIIRLPS